jgi:hypothetical protein
MRPKDGAADGPAFYDSLTKCCTYQPELPNFLVGATLSDKGTLARDSVIARIESRIGVTPLGVGVPPLYSAMYARAAPASGFGHARALRCPHHLDDGRCGIWLHRNAICATWYCKHVRGTTSVRFWRDGIEGLLRAVEESLARHCLAELGLATDAVLAILPKRKHAGSRDETPADRVEPATYGRVWGTWAGREQELYKTCARVVEPLTWSEVLAISGPTVRLLAGATRELHRAVLDRSLPATLHVGDFQIVGADGSSVRVSGYSPLDPIDVPKELFSVLHRFDGRSTRAILTSLRKKDGIALDDDFVRTLVDFGILVESRDHPARTEGLG